MRGCLWRVAGWRIQAAFQHVCALESWKPKGLLTFFAVLLAKIIDLTSCIRCKSRKVCAGRGMRFYLNYLNHFRRAAPTTATRPVPNSASDPGSGVVYS